MLAFLFGLGLVGQLPDEATFFTEEKSQDEFGLQADQKLLAQIDAQKFSGSCWNHYDTKFALAYMRSVFEQARELELLDLLSQCHDSPEWISAARFVIQAHCPPLNDENPGYQEEQLSVFDELLIAGMIQGLWEGSPEVSNIIVGIHLPKIIEGLVAKGVIERAISSEILPESMTHRPTIHSVFMRMLDSDRAHFGVLFASYLRHVSGKAMLMNLKKWDEVIKPAFISAASLWGKPEDYVKSREYYEISFHLLHLRRAMDDPDSRKLAEDFLRVEDPGVLASSVLSALKAGKSAENFAHELLVQHFGDDVWDRVILSEGSNEVKSQIMAAILERKRISKQSLEWIRSELKTHRNPLKGPIFLAATRWGESARGLLLEVSRSEVTGPMEEEYQKQAFRALARHYRLINEILNSQENYPRSLVVEIIDNASATNAAFVEAQADEILQLMPGVADPLPYNLDSDRKIFISGLYYFERHWESLNPDVRLRLIGLFPEWMKIPPDRLSDEALLRVVGQMKRSSEEAAEALVAYEKDLREGLGLK